MNDSALAKPPPDQHAGTASRLTWYSACQSTAFLYAMLGLATFFLFASVRNHGFVNIDDEAYVTENPHVRTGLTLENILWAFRTGHASNWHPLTWLSHMLDCQLFGLDPGKHHLVSVSLHTINSLLLFNLLSRLTGRKYRSLFVAALFALHPLRVESVAWVAERKDVLSGLFFFLTLSAYARYGEGKKCEIANPNSKTDSDSKIPPPASALPLPTYGIQPSASNDHPRRLRSSIFYLSSLCLFALGLMSKPMLVTTPFLFLILDYWPLHRAKTRFSNRASKQWRHLIWEKVPFMLLSFVCCAITLAVQKHGGAVQSSLSTAARFQNALVSYVGYLGKVFWPTNLAVLYPHPGFWPIRHVLTSTVILFVITAFVIVFAKSRPYLATGWFWFIGALVPVIGLVQVGLQSTADRYTYLPSIGLVIALVWGFAEITDQFKIRAAAIAVGTCTLIALSAVAVRQLRFWQDGETLLRHALQVTGNNYLILNNLGAKMSGSNAIQHFEAALKLNPASGDAHNNLGVELATRGDISAAIEHFRAAIAAQPTLASARSNLGMALAVQHKWAEAIAEYRESLRLNPDDPRVHSNLGNALDEQGNSHEAIAEYRQALRLNDANAEIHFNLALTLVKDGKREEAAAEYAAGLRIEPHNAQAQHELDTLRADSKIESP